MRLLLQFHNVLLYIMLAAAGITVEDTPQGFRWELAQ